MSEDLRNRYRRDYRNEPIRPQRPNTQPSNGVPPTVPPPSSSHPAQHPTTVQNMNSAPLPTEDTSSKHRPSSIKKLFILIIIILAVAGSSVFAYEKFGRTKTETKHYFPAYISKDQMTIPAYYPVNLPSDFKINNDYKVIQKDVLYYSVSNRAGDKFYITIQKLPTSFDFVAFKKKFVKPDEYNTPIGSNMVGPAGASLIGSIQTTKSVWIILNSTALGSTKDMETITRSLQEVPL